MRKNYPSKRTQQIPFWRVFLLKLLPYEAVTLGITCFFIACAESFPGFGSLRAAGAMGAVMAVVAVRAAMTVRAMGAAAALVPVSRQALQMGAQSVAELAELCDLLFGEALRELCVILPVLLLYAEHSLFSALTEEDLRGPLVVFIALAADQIMLLHFTQKLGHGRGSHIHILAQLRGTGSVVGVQRHEHPAHSGRKFVLRTLGAAAHRPHQLEYALHNIVLVIHMFLLSHCTLFLLTYLGTLRFAL